jgi:hypothetical protein
VVIFPAIAHAALADFGSRSWCTKTDATGHTDAVLLADVVATSDSVADAPLGQGRKAADLLGRLAPDEIEAVVGFLIGERQGRTGGLGDGLPARGHPGGGDADDRRRRPRSVNQTTTGSGSAASRQQILGDVFGRATLRDRLSGACSWASCAWYRRPHG